MRLHGEVARRFDVAVAIRDAGDGLTRIGCI
jgi:hypothetical protein